MPLEIPYPGRPSTPLTDAVIEGYRRGDPAPSEWQIGDALNEIGHGRRSELAVTLRQECYARNHDGARYSLARLEMIADIAHAFPPRERDEALSFSHYEDVLRAKLHGVIGQFCLGIAKEKMLAHKGLRNVIKDVRAATTVGADGMIVVDAMPQWGTGRLVLRAPDDDVQTALF